MGNYPLKIPAAHRKSAFRSECYGMGWNHAHGIACHNVPTIGANVFIDGEGHARVDSENIRELHESICYQAESNSRCFSPWEFTAHQINSSRNPEGGWQAYDDGVNDSIAADLAEYTDDDYGLNDL